MKDFKRILVPVDGSELSKKAFDKAISMAEMVGSSVDVLHVSEYPATGPIGMEQPPELEPGDQGELVLKPFKALAEEQNKDINTMLERGNPPDRIVERSGDYDIIIMGTHGRNPLASLVLGSVAEKVARNACCPVMLIREKNDGCSEEK